MVTNYGNDQKKKIMSTDGVNEIPPQNYSAYAQW